MDESEASIYRFNDMDENYFTPTIVTHSQESVKSSGRPSFDVGLQVYSLSTHMDLSPPPPPKRDKEPKQLLLSSRDVDPLRHHRCRGGQAATCTTLETIRISSLRYSRLDIDEAAFNPFSSDLESTPHLSPLYRPWVPEGPEESQAEHQEDFSPLSMFRTQAAHHLFLPMVEMRQPRGMASMLSWKVPL